MADPIDRRPLIAFAVPDETRPFLALATDRWGAERRDQAVRRGRGREVSIGPLRVLTVGIGPANAEASILAAFEVGTPAWVVTAGFAGALDPKLKLADLVWDADDAFPAWEWLERSGGRRGRFHCQARVAVTVQDKARLRRDIGADAVEMESGVLRALCAQRAIPSATFRVISDTADLDMPLDFNRCSTADLRLSPWRLVREILRHPGRIPRLVGFHAETRDAAGRLAEALMRLPMSSMRPIGPGSTG